PRHRTVGPEQSADGRRVGRGRIWPRRRGRRHRYERQAVDPAGTGAAGILEEVMDRMRPAVGQLNHPVEQLALKAARKLPEVAEELPRGVRVRERPVWMRMAQPKLAG